MSSEVDICKLALAAIRAKSINSLNEATNEAQQCKLHYPTVRNRLLSSADLNFNSSVKALNPLSSTTIFNWRHVYSYPDDCLYISRLIPNIETNTVLTDVADVEYEVMSEGNQRVIVSNYDELRIKYRKVVEDPNQFEINFEHALINMLASEIAMPIIGVERANEVNPGLLQKYEFYMNQALVNAANQFDQPSQESELITVRD